MSSKSGGTNELGAFLGIRNRADRKAFLGISTVKHALKQIRSALPRELRNAQRERVLLLAFYSLPGERRALWKATFHLPGGERADDAWKSLPSFEQKAFERYDPDFLERPWEPETARKALSDWPELADRVEEAADWQRPALSLWPSIRRDVEEWEALGEAGREALAPATLAVATIADDVRLLRWAAEQVTALAEEYAFALESERDEDDTVDDDAQVETSPIEAWNTTCDEIVRVTGMARGEPPDPDQLADLTAHIETLEKLEKTVRRTLAKKKSVAVLESVEKVVRDLAARVPRLSGNLEHQLVARWHREYPPDCEEDVVDLEADLARMTGETPSAAERFLSAEAEVVALEEELASLSRSESADLATEDAADERRNALHIALAEAGRGRRAALQAILDCASPRGQAFDPKHDYVHESSDSDSERKAAVGAVEADLGLAGNEKLAARPDSTAPAPSVDEAFADEPCAKTRRKKRDEDDAEEAEFATAERTVAILSEKDRASRMPDADPPSAAQYNALEGSLWRHIADRRLGLAYFLAEAASGVGEVANAVPAPSLVSMAALGNTIEVPDGEISAELMKTYAEFDPRYLDREALGLRDALNLMLFAGCLRPALIAPLTGATAWLRRVRLSEPLIAAFDLAQGVCDRAETLQGMRLGTTQLRSVLSQATWDNSFAQLIEESRQWRRLAESQRVFFKPANRVWREWNTRDGMLAELMDLMTSRKEQAVERVQEIADMVHDQASFERLVHDTDRRVNGCTRDPEIEARAMKQLYAHARSAAVLASEWLSLMASRPDSRGFIQREIDGLCKLLHRLGPAAKRALAEVGRKHVDTPLGAASEIARSSIEAFETLFDLDAETPSMPPEEPAPNVVLGTDLLFVTGLDLDTSGRPIGAPASVYAALMDSSSAAVSLVDAFTARLGRGDLIGADLARKRAEELELPDAETLTEKWQHAADARRSALAKVISSTRDAVELAFSYGYLAESDRSAYAGDLVQIEARFDSLIEFLQSEPRVIAIQNAIEESRDHACQQARARFAELKMDDEGDDARRIRGVLQAGDILTANEFMSQIASGQHLEPDADPVPEALESFYPDAVRLIESARTADATSDVPAMIREISVRRDWAELPFSKLTEDEAKEAAMLLETWFSLSHSKRLDNWSMKRLLTQLGLAPRSLRKIEESTEWVELHLDTDPLTDRALCPIPLYGSSAKGQYRIVASWGTRAQDAIPQALRDQPGRAQIILYFGRLGSARESLALAARDQQRAYLTIDETLVLFLAARGGSRLKTLFECALPFSYAEPFDTTASLVPAELFYGRVRERASILDRHGACFIYGGRQLGKTALLRAAERHFHAPDRRNFAKWLDLKVHEIGYSKEPVEIWPVLWRELKALEVIDSTQPEPNPGNAGNIESLVGAVESWLAGHSDRRLLLLLDEADAFLEQDARGEYRESTRLKDLMDRTDRRFKVVFAGLHNVLRTTEQANHPLAHLGDPINVGPLLTDGEWHEAQALVREPLAAAGYVFEPADLPTRILAQTNYYPSLIQLYGAELIRKIRDVARDGPPFRITERDVDGAARSPELRNQIRERFHLTLQLDQRYEVIAYAIALEFITAKFELGQGVPVEELRDAVRGWWPEGFEISDTELHTLFEEMVGLGVLRKVGGGRYTLRNPNVLLLLGEIGEIEQILDKHREPPQVFEPGSFHARYPQEKDAIPRS